MGLNAKRLEIQSPNARLCVTMALTTANDRRFKQCCGHGRCDGTVGEAPLCWNEEVLKREGRPSRKEDWNADCEFCAKKAGKVTMCSDCNVVICSDCAKTKMNDVDRCCCARTPCPRTPAGRMSTST